MTTEANRSRSGVIALALCLGGLVIASAIGVLASARGYRGHTPAYLVFLGFQVAAFVLGMASKGDRFGKTACITSAVLAVGSILFVC